jgi:hypothetical protein
MLAFARPTECVATVTVYGYTDKYYYSPGESVKLMFWVYNEGPDKIILENVTVQFPWHKPVWDGNITIPAANTVLDKGQSWNRNVTFTIPNDGRANNGGPISVEVVYWIGGTVYKTKQTACSLNINPLPELALKDMDKLLTLITVQVVLVIVCTIILAATIFLSRRRPKTVFEEETKAE